jgi:uncharacterized protein (DUF302 family)
MPNELAFRVELNQPYDRAIETVTAALKGEGFGVLTRIDMRATMKEKLGKEFRPYAILGACNPTIAYRTLTHDPRFGLLLPCNVTVEENAMGGSIVNIINPRVMVAWAGEPDEEMREVAEEGYRRLQNVALALQKA